MATRFKKTSWGKQLLYVSTFAGVLIMGTALLFSRLIDGAAFVTLIIAGGLGVSIYALLPSIAEFSIGGNTVKFQEKLDEAQRITDELRKIRNIAVTTTLRSLKLKPVSNFILYQNIIEFRNVYQVISDTDMFAEEYQMLVTETALTLREHVGGYIDHDLPHQGPKWLDWKDESIRQYILSLENKTDIPLGEKMSLLFAQQYLLLSDFIYKVNQGELPELKIVSQDGEWKVIMKGSTWKEA
ncbi:hypothetical protein [Nissabacter sp. SGAir0207]|uniref:hypothetical protein n=1 Tax=Nissabacter sp. SGAir0207 TaxID=2126321 RepID=UPI0010CD1D8F|nr:hypothetical protein [Nissabacter sp. SGAir0207]QCR38608.1 hypothetical protein C1N62_20905 [Nissabacter sp. SGAir0207]